MATINAPSMQDTVYSGDCPLAPAHGYVNLAAAQVGDKVRLNKVYAGTKIMSGHYVNAALGANTTVALGYEFVNGELAAQPNALIPAAATNAAGVARSAVAPIVLPYDAYIIATIGGAAASGQLDTVITYEFKSK